MSAPRDLNEHIQYVVEHILIRCQQFYEQQDNSYNTNNNPYSIKLCVVFKDFSPLFYQGIPASFTFNLKPLSVILVWSLGTGFYPLLLPFANEVYGCATDSRNPVWGCDHCLVNYYCSNHLRQVHVMY